MKSIIIIICICILLLFVVGCKDCEYEYIGDIVDFEISAGGAGAVSLAKVTTSQNKSIIIKDTAEGWTPYNAFDDIAKDNKVYESSVCSNRYIIKRR